MFEYDKFNWLESETVKKLEQDYESFIESMGNIINNHRYAIFKLKDHLDKDEWDDFFTKELVEDKIAQHKNSILIFEKNLVDANISFSILINTINEELEEREAPFKSAEDLETFCVYKDEPDSKDPSSFYDNYVMSNNRYVRISDIFPKEE